MQLLSSAMDNVRRGRASVGTDCLSMFPAAKKPDVSDIDSGGGVARGLKGSKRACVGAASRRGIDASACLGTRGPTGLNI